ncbi:GntR family transcriptional regulator [Sphingomonas sp. QA11]|uniref:GntR family transcriptional regulator n=1 Tax=Sphingomonas sp. QA11 TaxID=2950605 RepID=UPI002349F0FA|nr:GntR family transcriptional regulator [Sphingomonas sp. QA11]WCM26318.1 GntR family transcriptional regulator [Sphingomonas sp. QA11]
MSPGATFERVYKELKRMLAAGELPPGAPIEPALIGQRIASSITPIRDALHRLTGEGLVEAPNHNGFRARSLNEKALRDLYGWNWQVLELSTRHLSTAIPIIVEDATGEDVATASAKLFEKLAHGTQNNEHPRAVRALNGRLAPFRRLEAVVLQGLDEEYQSLVSAILAGNGPDLRRLLASYHRRRLGVVPALLAAASP